MMEHNMEHVVFGPKHPVPPHERRGMISLRFDEKDRTVLTEVFGGEDEAAAAEGIVHSAPPEIQILVAQLLAQIEKEEA